MKLAIIGAPQSGKTTLFNALTSGHAAISPGGRSKEANIGVVKVPDRRIDRLAEIYEPEKTIYAQVEYFDVSGIGDAVEKKAALDDKILNLLRPVDALVLSARNFKLSGLESEPWEEIQRAEADLRIADYMVTEKRISRIDEEAKRGRKANEAERDLLMKCLTHLEAEQPLRTLDEISSPYLKGFGFLSAKPMLWVINSEEPGSVETDRMQIPRNTLIAEIPAKLEMELSQLSPEESALFRDSMEIDEEPALDRLIRDSYKLLGLISFFTVGKDEVRAWTIRAGTNAHAAAGAIHSDIEKGFIRAEVLAYDDLIEFGSYAQAQKKGKTRLEGKEYIVQDGDIINFRFKV